MTKKKKNEPIYTLNIFHFYDEKIKKNGVLFLVQTTKIFVSFQYEILLEDQLEGQNIILKIAGLHVPELLMPATGPARGWRHYNNLIGTYNLKIIKQDKTENDFLLEITSSNVQIKRKPPRPFILISNEPVEFY